MRRCPCDVAEPGAIRVDEIDVAIGRTILMRGFPGKGDHRTIGRPRWLEIIMPLVVRQGDQAAAVRVHHIDVEVGSNVDQLIISPLEEDHGSVR